MIGMRNVLAHNYFEIDLELVWAAIEEDVPNLKHNVETTLKPFCKLHPETCTERSHVCNRA